MGHLPKILNHSTKLIILVVRSVDSSGFICQAEMFRFIPFDSNQECALDPHYVSPNRSDLFSLNAPPNPNFEAAAPAFHENSIPPNCTDFLVGSTFIQPTTIQYQGQKILVFAFTVSSGSFTTGTKSSFLQDLSSKLVGDFVLR